MHKPYSESCDQNRDPILRVIEPLLADARAVLEIGSGTGQHAVYFAARMPHLVWHSSDQPHYLPGIRLWLAEAGLQNTADPVDLDVNDMPWPQLDVDAVYSANTCHIMHWKDVEAMFAGVAGVLRPGGKFLLYGPFNYDGVYTSASNASFDAWLQSRDPGSGLKDFADLDRIAAMNTMKLQNDYTMPANNRILYWVKD